MKLTAYMHDGRELTLGFGPVEPDELPMNSGDREHWTREFTAFVAETTDDDPIVVVADDEEPKLLDSITRAVKLAVDGFPHSDPEAARVLIMQIVAGDVGTEENPKGVKSLELQEKGLL